MTPGLGRSPGEEKGSPLQYSGLENSMDCIVHVVTKSRTQLSDFHFLFFQNNFQTLVSSRLGDDNSNCKVSYPTHGLPWWLSGKEPTSQCRRHGFNPWVRKIRWRRKWQPIPALLPGKSHRQTSLVDYGAQHGIRAGSDLVTKQQQQYPTHTILVT